MNTGKFRDQNWYPYAVALCIGAAFFVLLTQLDSLLGAVGTFIGYFKAVILGCVLAYLMNPLSRRFAKSVFRGVRAERVRWTLSVILTVLTAILLLLLLLGLLIPQLTRSVLAFAGNFDGYAESLQKWLSSSGLPLAGTALDPQRLSALSENAMKEISAFVRENASRILSTAAGAGKNVVTWVIALILSVYLLSAKDSLKAGTLRLLHALLPEARANGVIEFFRRCDGILVSYVTDSLLESVIVGGANAVFMAIFGMQYVGLISVVVAVTNLIPTFGPIVGGVVGAFILLLVDPLDALLFIAFTFVLQFIDGYVIKPKLFGGALGVSGLLILIAVIVCGNMFGVVGVLLSIPIAAISSFVYSDYLLPALERRRK